MENAIPPAAMFGGYKCIFGPACDPRVVKRWKDNGGTELLRGDDYSSFDVDFFFTPEFLGNTPGARVQRSSTPRHTLNNCMKWFKSLNSNGEGNESMSHYVSALRESWILDSLDAGKVLPNSDYIVFEETTWSNKKVYEPLSVKRGKTPASQSSTAGKIRDTEGLSPTIRHLDFKNVSKSTGKKRSNTDNIENERLVENGEEIDGPGMDSSNNGEKGVINSNEEEELFDCEYKCGFFSTFKVVEEHEKTCKYNPEITFDCDFKCGFCGTYRAVEKHEKTCLNKRRNWESTGLSPVKKKRKIVSDGSDTKGDDKRESSSESNRKSPDSPPRSTTTKSSLLLTPSNTQDAALPSVDLDDSQVNEEEYKVSVEEGASLRQLSPKLEYNEFGYPEHDRWDKKADKVLKLMETSVEENELGDADEYHDMLLHRGFTEAEIENRRNSNVNKLRHNEQIMDEETMDSSDGDDSYLY